MQSLLIGVLIHLVTYSYQNNYYYFIELLFMINENNSFLLFLIKKSTLLIKCTFPILNLYINYLLS